MGHRLLNLSFQPHLQTRYHLRREAFFLAHIDKWNLVYDPVSISHET